MKEHFKFPSISQFRQVVREVKSKACFVGLDEAGEPIFDSTKLLPVLEYEGTVKLHGSNSSVVVLEDGSYYCQSRNRVLSIEDDHLGFARFVQDHNVAALFPKNTVVWGEIAGKGVQQKVAICNLPKTFVVFEAKNLLTGERIDIKDWRFDNDRVFNIYEYPVYSISIDFNNPEASTNQIALWIEAVEKECPVAKSFGFSGIGEGLVFRCKTPGFESSKFWFKAKGEEHSNTPTKVFVAVDPEKLASIDAFIEKHVTESRLNQGLEFLKEMGHELTEKSTGHFIKWINGDVIKEQKDEMEASGIEPKEFCKFANSKIKKWFFTKIK